ncbi:MAG TPA: AsmA-like C-terminal region-containing protein [Hyphomicrobiaceae bacterium]|nr:AsmA-like C-terminal region-containing protein [Hyphomicrobiaceae bacterium]
MALAGIVALGLLYVRLMYGPLVMSFLAGPIESAIAEELAGPRVQVGGVALSLNNLGLIQFELKNVRVSDDAGETLVAAPAVAVSLSRRALLTGRIAVESLDLTSARLVLFYADDGTLALKFSPAAAVPAAGGTTEVSASPPVPAMAAGSGDAPPAEGDGLLGRIDLVKVLAEASARARRQEHASAYLREIGLRAATVVIDNGRNQTVWQVPELDVDLDHRRTRSSIAGRARIESPDGPWELTFRSLERVQARTLKLAVSVQGLVPHALAQAFPNLLALEGFDLPISAEGHLELSDAGDLLSGKVAIDTAGGNVSLPGRGATPMRIGSGHVELSYDGAARSFEIAPSEVSWGEGRVKLAGTIAHTTRGTEGPRWAFVIKTSEGWISADPQSPMRLPIDELSAVGFLAPEQGRIVLDRFVVQAGGAEASVEGEMSDLGGTIQARLDGRISAMSIGLFKTMWPSWLAPQARIWAAQRIIGGEVQGGSFKIVRGGPAQSQGDWTPVSESDRFTLVLEGSNLQLVAIDDWPALEIPRALLRVEGTSVELTIPEAVQASRDGRNLSLKGTFSVDLGETLPRHGQLTLKGSGPLSLVMDIIQHQAPSVLQNAGFSMAGSEGNVEGSLTLKLPLAPQPQFQEATIEGRLRISDGKLPRLANGRDIQGINVDVDIAPGAFEAKGRFLAGNVPATLSWQHVYGAPAEKQPPLRIAAVLYEAERAELGLDIDDLVHGEAAVEVAVTQNAQGTPQIHLRANLANAELAIESLGWRKPAGKRAVFELDFAKGTAYPIELQNVRLDGDGIAIAGWMGMGDDMRVREYRFPQFSLDVVSNFEAHGKLRPDNVWDVTAKGPTFDGRDLFKSFFFVPNQKPDKNRPGLDLHAEFDTVLGFFDTSARNVRLSMQKRANRLNQLDMRAALSGGKKLDASVRPEPGRPRTLIARSNDAGQVFKLVGFLPHAIGGDLNLEVNIDGKGSAERTGTLSVARFTLLGDAISVETGKGGRRNVVRERFEFDSLRAPFSVSAGQFVLNNAGIDGPLMSATMNGRVDFRTRKVHMTGTFTPLAALNKMFSDVPLFGDIITGPNREGVFALNFGVQGALENPQVVVNPFSVVAPGVTREAFPIMSEEPTQAPRKSSSKRSSKGTRSSSSPVARPGAPDSIFPTPP